MKKTSVDMPAWGEQYKDLAEAILSLVAYYRTVLGLEHWDIKVHLKEICETDATTAADCGAEPEYYAADVTFYLAILAERPVEELPGFVRHELLHVWLWPLATMANDLTENKFEKVVMRLDERVTSDLERMPVWDLLWEEGGE